MNFQEVKHRWHLVEGDSTAGPLLGAHAVTSEVGIAPLFHLKDGKPQLAAGNWDICHGSCSRV